MGQLAILQPIRLIFGVNLFTSCGNHSLFTCDISIGVGIILFTVLIRTLLLPVFQVQWWRLEKCRKLNHALRRFENQYPGRDMESRTKARCKKCVKSLKKWVSDSQILFGRFDSDAGYLGLVPSSIKSWLFKTGHFLWINLGGVDTTLVLPILAAVFTFFKYLVIQ